MEAKQLNDETIPKKVSGTIDTLDAKRSEGLDDMQAIQQKRNTAMSREKNRLASKYGDDHPRVQKITSRQTYNQGFQRDLQVETTRTKYTPPPIDLQTWQVQGRVLNEDRKGLPDLIVALYDTKGKLFESIKHDCTDEAGFFSLSFTTDNQDESKELTKVPLILTVATKEMEIVCQDTSRPLFIRPGQIDYREIVLGEKEGQCPPPPPRTGNDENGDDGNGRGIPGDRIVLGRVLSFGGRPVGNVLVSAYDVNRTFDEKLGEAVTNANGEYKIPYSYKGAEAGEEIGPDLFVTVLSSGRTLLFSSENNPRKNAKKEEVFEITLRVNN